MIKFSDLQDLEASFSDTLSASFLGGEIGRMIDRKIQSKYGDIEAIRRVGYNKETGLVEGSNPFYVAAVDEFSEKYGLKPANLSDLQKAVMLNQLDSEKGLDMFGKYEDAALVINGNRPNSFLSLGFLEQLGINQNSKPVVIPLNSLKLKRDKRSPQGLSFALRKYAQVIETDMLEKPGYYRTGDIDMGTGLPMRMNEDGDRYLFGHGEGLQRLCLGTGMCLVPNIVNISGTRSNGRIVMVKD